MKLRIIAVGKVKNQHLRLLAEDYVSRIGHYFPIETVDVKDEKSTLKSLTVNDFLVICDENGMQKKSIELASFIKAKQDNIKRMIFFIGGPDGIGKEIKKKADFLLSLSKMTFVHEMAQVILLEQLYRACTIIRGEKYHRISKVEGRM